MLNVLKQTDYSVSHSSRQRRTVGGNGEAEVSVQSLQNQSRIARAWIPLVYLGTCVLSITRNTCLGESYPTSVAAQLLQEVALGRAERQKR